MAKNKKKSKFNYKIAALAASGILLVAGMAAQAWYNLYIWDVTQEQSAFKMGTLIKTAIDNLDQLKTDLGDDSRIEELRLQLPQDNQDVEGIRYMLFDSNNSSSRHNSDYAQVTSRSLVLGEMSQLLVQRNMDDLFEVVPGTQACSRGFTLQFSEQFGDSGSLSLSGTKTLGDGRTLYVYRETTCDAHYGVDELEAYLLRSESY